MIRSSFQKRVILQTSRNAFTDDKNNILKELGYEKKVDDYNHKLMYAEAVSMFNTAGHMADVLVGSFNLNTAILVSESKVDIGAKIKLVIEKILDFIYKIITFILDKAEQIVKFFTGKTPAEHNAEREGRSYDKTADLIKENMNLQADLIILKGLYSSQLMADEVFAEGYAKLYEAFKEANARLVANGLPQVESETIYGHLGKPKDDGTKFKESAGDDGSRTVLRNMLFDRTGKLTDKARPHVDAIIKESVRKTIDESIIKKSGIVDVMYNKYGGFLPNNLYTGDKGDVVDKISEIVVDMGYIASANTRRVEDIMGLQKSVHGLDILYKDTLVNDTHVQEEDYTNRSKMQMFIHMFKTPTGDMNTIFEHQMHKEEADNILKMAVDDSLSILEELEPTVLDAGMFDRMDTIDNMKEHIMRDQIVANCDIDKVINKGNGRYMKSYKAFIKLHDVSKNMKGVKDDLVSREKILEQNVQGNRTQDEFTKMYNAVSMIGKILPTIGVTINIMSEDAFRYCNMVELILASRVKYSMKFIVNKLLENTN